MAIGRITGPMLNSNLDRQGVNLAIDANVAYFDVTNRRVGVNNSSPSYALDVTGNAHLGNLYILGNAITTDSGYKLNLGNISNIAITGGSANYVIYTDGNGNLTFGNLDTLSGVEGFTANYITLGSNTVGALSSNAGSFTVNTTVTDSIATLNQILGNITNSTGSTIHVSGNITAGNINSVFYGNLFGNVTATGNISGTFVGNLYGNVTGNVTGTVLTPYQPYITTVGTLGNLQVTSNTSTGNLLTNNIFYANGAPWNFGSTYSNANVASYLPTYSGNLSPGNVTSVFYGNINTDVIRPLSTNVTIFNSNTAIGLPSGSSTQYPTSNVAGYFRYNTTINTVEYYNGTVWVPIMNSITDQVIIPDGVNQTFTLNQTTNAIGIIVSINGVLQQPNASYTVSGNQITFAEIPLVSDVVDIRFIGSAVSVSLDYEIVDTGNITVNTSNVIVDTFNSSQYRGAKYIVSSVNGTDASILEIQIAQSNGVVAVGTSANVNTGSNYLTFYANTAGSTVNLVAKGTTISNQLRIQRTYFNI